MSILEIYKKYTWVGHLYPDWFREPVSPLERTWRWPLALREAQQLVGQKLGVKIPSDYYIAKKDWLYIRTDYKKLLWQWGTLTVLFRFFGRISTARHEFEAETLPEYRSLLSTWRKENIVLKDMPNKKLWLWANQVMEIDVAYTIKIVYVGTYGFLFDSLLAKFYKLLVKDDFLGYQALLGGFQNRTHEMNVELFRLSKINKDDEAFSVGFANFLYDFGLEKSDWELAFPVLREYPEAIRHLIEAYRIHPELDPEQRLKNLRAKRQAKHEFALRRLKCSLISKPIFKWILRWAQVYVPLRETRQHYIGAGTYFIRQALKVLENRLGLQEDLIFYLEKQEIEKAINGELNLPSLISTARERYKLRELQKQSKPEK